MFRAGKLLVVDDEPSVRSSLREILEHEGHEVVTAASGEEALSKLSEGSFDLVLVDLKMEGINGLEVMTEAKQLTPDTVVIMLTAYGTLDSAIGALRQGAHDYLLKPCNVEEIVASVETGLARRWSAIHRQKLMNGIEDSIRQLQARTVPLEAEAEDVSVARFIRTRHVILDREKQIVVAKGKPVLLTPTEYRLLACLMGNIGRTLGFRELAQEVLGCDLSEREARSALKTHLWRLRKKLEATLEDVPCIVNVRGKGYMFVP
ncbi:MAG: response regulator [Anaerolineae bacterium]|nr:response regulator [Anaerolineae bacterium]NIN93968.1 response regulator [Anaerolineae bacterium]NIQ77001.1 response regulator [Anaerolineae bacterium]